MNDDFNKSVEEHRRQNKMLERLVTLIMVLAMVGGVTLAVGVLWVAVHFLSKVW